MYTYILCIYIYIYNIIFYISPEFGRGAPAGGGEGEGEARDVHQSAGYNIL